MFFLFVFVFFLKYKVPLVEWPEIQMNHIVHFYDNVFWGNVYRGSENGGLIAVHSCSLYGITNFRKNIFLKNKYICKQTQSQLNANNSINVCSGFSVPFFLLFALYALLYLFLVFAFVLFF